MDENKPIETYSQITESVESFGQIAEPMTQSFIDDIANFPSTLIPSRKIIELKIV